VSDLDAALTRLTDTERLYVLRALAVRAPNLVTREAIYVHSRRWLYPTPPLETR
jgi:hypothetical protein